MDSSTGQPLTPRPPVPPPLPKPPQIPSAPAAPVPPPAPKPAPTPVAVPKPPAVPPLAMRTMQDDIADLRKAAASLAASRKPPIVSSKPVSPPLAVVDRPAPISAKSVTAPMSKIVTPLSTATAAVHFPLPARPAESQKIIATPGARPNRHIVRKLVVTLMTLIVTGGLAGGGWYGWTHRTNLTQLIHKTPVVLSAGEVLPAQAEVLLGYNLASAEQRSSVTTAWSKVTAADTAMTTLLAGNPTTLLTDPDLKEFYYVILDDEPRPYLVVPKTVASEKLLAGIPTGQLLERGGWYIVHPLNVSPYEAALTKGNRTANVAEATSGQISLELSATMLNEIRKTSAGAAYAQGQLTGVQGTSNFSANGGVLNFSGTTSWQTTPTGTALTDQLLLTLVPADVSLARFGSNWQADVTRWLEVSKILNGDVLARPAVKALTDQLTTPYAFYQRLGEDGSPDVGLIIELPPALKGKLALGDSTIEQGLLAAVPLLVDRREVTPLAFTDRTYADLSLRYINLVGTTQTLDYTVTDTHLLVATSKEGMLALVDAAKGNTASVSEGPNWQGLLTAWGILPAGQDLVVGQIHQPQLLQLLPHNEQETALPFGFVITPKDAAVTMTGVVQLSK